MAISVGCWPVCCPGSWGDGLFVEPAARAAAATTTGSCAATTAAAAAATTAATTTTARDFKPRSAIRTYVT